MYINPTTQKIFVWIKICVYTSLSEILAQVVSEPPYGKTLRSMVTMLRCLCLIDRPPAGHFSNLHLPKD